MLGGGRGSGDFVGTWLLIVGVADEGPCGDEWSAGGICVRWLLVDEDAEREEA